jgi:competence protein ComEC
LGTSLLSISLFGYFPTYFLIANIILIPLTAFVVYLSVTALIVQLLFGEGDKLLLIISKILEVMITVANRIDSLPFSKIG